MKSLLFSFFFIAILWLPQTSEAYFTTSQQAFSEDGKTAVFFIEYSFGHKSHDIHIPIWTQLATETSNDKVSFKVIDEEDETAKGSFTSIVLSNAQVKDGMYVIPKGKVAKLTFVAFYTPSADETERTFRAHMTHLPFSFSGTQQLQLNPSELAYYITPEVTLK